MSQMVIYQSEDGSKVSVRLEGDTLWLKQEQMAELFSRERSVITRHLRNIFKDGELDEASNVQNLHIAGSDKPVKFYSLNAIISVGYRVNSKRGTQFRQWATGVLHEHLKRGWTLDRARMARNAAELEAALRLIRKTAQAAALTGQAGRGLAEIANRYTQTFLLLQRYDEGLLSAPIGTVEGVLPTVMAVRHSIAQLKADLIARGEASDLFGCERNGALEAILGNLNQTVCGAPAYPTIESKAAHLLYFIVKNHPLLDGNKRTAAFLFVDFLYRNDALIRNGQPVINDIGLVALTLLVAESAPRQKDAIIRLVENMLAGLPEEA